MTVTLTKHSKMSLDKQEWRRSQRGQAANFLADGKRRSLGPMNHLETSFTMVHAGRAA